MIRQNLMVTKHITMEHADRSSMERLIRYITDTQGKENRVGEVFITNCASDTPEMAALEMLATQDANKRSKADKTYHAVVSFHIGEHPTPDVLKAIEAEICKKLKMEDHQRIAVVHYDTTCVHMHLAINKVHPEKHTVVNPLRDHLILGKISEQLEKKFSLRHTNHKPTGKTAGQRKARDMEAMTGEESLLTWIRRECFAELQKATTWDELHTIAAKSGLTVAKRGNGIIFKDHTGQAVTGSDIDRSFSKSNLEKHLGAFQPSGRSVDLPAPEKGYDKRPIGGNSSLREEFEQFRSQTATSRKDDLAAIRDDYSRQLATLRAENKAARFFAGHSQVGRRALYKLVSLRQRQKMRCLREEAAKKRRELFAEHPKQNWLSWLQEQAQAGRPEAIAALRSRGFYLAKKRSAEIGGDVAQNPVMIVADLPIDTVTKCGIIIYKVGAAAIRDDGVAFRVSRDADRNTDLMALKLAKQRYGKNLHIHGDQKFRERMLRAAVENRLAVTFADPELEAKRQEMMLSTQNLKQTALERK